MNPKEHPTQPQTDATPHVTYSSELGSIELSNTIGTQPQRVPATQQKRRMALIKKVLFITLTTMLLAPTLGIIYFVTINVISVIEGQKSEKLEVAAIKLAAKDIVVPSGYKLVKSEFTNYHCMDVCANVSNEYTIDKSTPVNPDVIRTQLIDKGYRYEYASPYSDSQTYTKKINGIDIDAELTYRASDSTLMWLTFSKDLDYLDKG